jgi:hypothetical protein
MNCARGHLGLFAAVILTALAIGATGCRSTPKIDWDSRVGNYSYDQAIIDLGPPDRTAALSDGRTVAEWVVRRNPGGAFSIGTGVYGGRTGVSVGQTVPVTGRDRILRLVFDQQNLLSSWAGG